MSKVVVALYVLWYLNMLHSEFEDKRNDNVQCRPQKSHFMGDSIKLWLFNASFATVVRQLVSEAVILDFLVLAKFQYSTT